MKAAANTLALECHSQLSDLRRILGGEACPFDFMSCCRLSFRFFLFRLPDDGLIPFMCRAVSVGLGSRLAPPSCVEFGKLNADSHPELELSAKLRVGLGLGGASISSVPILMVRGSRRRWSVPNSSILALEPKWRSITDFSSGGGV